MKAVKYNFPAIIVILPGDKIREAKGVPLVKSAEFDKLSNKTIVTMAADRNWRPQERNRAMTALKTAFLHVAGKVISMEHYRAGVDIPLNKLIQKR